MEKNWNSSTMRYRVWPVEFKPRYYSNLYDISKDFSRKELEGADISVLMGPIAIVGYVDTEKVLDEVFRWKEVGK